MSADTDAGSSPSSGHEMPPLMSPIQMIRFLNPGHPPPDEGVRGFERSRNCHGPDFGPIRRRIGRQTDQPNHLSGDQNTHTGKSTPTPEPTAPRHANRYPSILGLRTEWPWAVDAALTLGRVLSQGSVRYGTLLCADERDWLLLINKRVVGNVHSHIVATTGTR